MSFVHITWFFVVADTKISSFDGYLASLNFKGRKEEEVRDNWVDASHPMIRRMD